MNKSCKNCLQQIPKLSWPQVGQDSKCRIQRVSLIKEKVELDWPNSEETYNRDRI